MVNRLTYILNRIRERLWVRPLAMCIVSVGAVFLANLMDRSFPTGIVPEITLETIKELLKILASSMLVIATFAVGSMVAAYNLASRTATPRSLAVVISDDVSQNALSRFIGAFIFSIVGLIALMHGMFDKGGRFALFSMTLMVFAVVILNFVRWVDRIARLGHLENTINKLEATAQAALVHRRDSPFLGGFPADAQEPQGVPVYPESTGYIKRIDMEALQEMAHESGLKLHVISLPGAFVHKARALVLVDGTEGLEQDSIKAIRRAFAIGTNRTFDEDPRFGLIVLSEIASRALSPGVNDPGTAIQVIGCLVRLLIQWSEPRSASDSKEPQFNRISVPAIQIQDLFDDAFRPIGRDGAAMLEVGLRLQKALGALAAIGDEQMKVAAGIQAELAMEQARKTMGSPADLNRLEEAYKALA